MVLFKPSLNVCCIRREERCPREREFKIARKTSSIVRNAFSIRDVGVSYCHLAQKSAGIFHKAAR